VLKHLKNFGIELFDINSEKDDQGIRAESKYVVKSRGNSKVPPTFILNTTLKMNMKTPIIIKGFPTVQNKPKTCPRIDRKNHA
jgi:hypothetical protein